jgi:HK97 family phage major capsid protein
MTPEEIKAHAARMQALNNEVKALIADPNGDMARAETLLTEVAAIKGRVDMAARSGAVDSWLTAPAGGLPHAGLMGFAEGPAGFTDVDGGRITQEAGEGILNDAQKSLIASTGYKSCFMRLIRCKGSLSDMGRTAVKSIMEGADGYGGFWSPEDWQASIVQKKAAPTATADFTRKLTTARDAVVMPTVRWTGDDVWTTGIRFKWTGEVPATSTTARVNFPVDGSNGFGQARIPVYTAMMSLPLTENQIEDAGFDISGWASDQFREGVDLGFDDLIMNGTGVGQPTGIMAQIGSGADQINTIASGNANLLTSDGILKLYWGTPPQYEDNCRYFMNKISAGQACGLLKDGGGRPLWGMGLQDAGLESPQRGRLLAGYPVTWNVFMPNVSASATPIVFGDMRGYYQVNRSALSIRVLNELYAETNQVLLLGRLRTGGQVVEPWRLRAQVVLA